ncbi:MoxR family ATPase [bacterium 210820-DFI.6.37]|nr:MoxR family ATPase [bacterium 210820-DFI.6.37]
MNLTKEELMVISQKMNRIIDNIETVIIGKRNVVELVVLSLICGGHVLIEDVPGVGKTSLVSALAKSIACHFKRIQFTPDIMPSDVTGFSIFNQKTREFEFRPGAVISNIVLADEINRASAKTQASLLEVMEERQITVDSKTYKLQEPFMVLATQNPLESFGTYPLPEAQIDRFLIKLSIGYPSFDEEVKVVSMGKKAKAAIKAVVSGQDVVKLREAAERVYIDPSVARYIVEIVTATRNHPELQIGSSPRGSIALYGICRAYAMYRGRNYVIPDDVKKLAPHVLCHRITLTHEAKINKRTARQVMEDILGSIVVPAGQETQSKEIRA